MSLTEREVTIIRLVAQGMTDEEIAKRLNVSTRTVESHLGNMARKHPVKKGNRRCKMVASALLAGIIDIADLVPVTEIVGEQGDLLEGIEGTEV